MPHYIPSSCFLRLFLVVTVSQRVLVFGDLDSFAEDSLGPSFGVSLMLFLMTRLGLWALGRKATEGKWHSHRILSKVRQQSTWLSTVDVDLEHLAEVLFVRFLYCQVSLSPPFHSGLYGKMLLCAAHTEGARVSVESVFESRVSTEISWNSSTWRFVYSFNQWFVYITTDSSIFILYIGL